MVAVLHRVRRQCWRVGAGSESEALDTRKRLRGLLDEDIGRAFENAFERAVSGEGLVHIPSLVLQLRISSIEALPVALEAAIARELSMHVSESRITANENRLQVLLSYLATGVLPWHAAGEDADAMTAQMRRTLLSEFEEAVQGAPSAESPQSDARVDYFFRLLELLPVESRSEFALRIGGPGVSGTARALAVAGRDAQKSRAAMARAAAELATIRGVNSATGVMGGVPEPNTEERTHALSVSHAGLILLHPFLAALLQAVNLYTPGEGLGPAPARAAALLHWLATGREDVHEFELPFIKVLLGLKPDSPLPIASGLLTLRDCEEGAALLRAALGHWKALKGTSVEGLRVSFLQRGGALRDTPASWHLQLESEPFDMLLERLSWSYATVKLPWMTRPLFTDWPKP